MDTHTSLLPSLDPNQSPTDSQPAAGSNPEEESTKQPSEGNQTKDKKDIPEKQSIKEYVLSKYDGSAPVYSTKRGFLYGLPSDLERLQAKLLSQTVQRKGHKFQLLNDFCVDPNVLSRPLAKFSVETLNQAADSKLNLWSSIHYKCILNSPSIAAIWVLSSLFFIACYTILLEAPFGLLVAIAIGFTIAAMSLANYLESDHFHARIGTPVETVQQKKQEQLLENIRSLNDLKKSIIEAHSKLTRLEEDIKARKEEASTLPKSDELYVTLYMLLQTVILKTGESQTTTCDLIREALKRAQEHPSINRIPLGDTAIKGIMAKARATFTPAVNDRGPKDQIATDVRKIIEDVIKSSTIVK